MNIQDLKQDILDGNVSDELIIFVCPDGNTKIANEYIDAICEQKVLDKNFISSLAETTESSVALVFDFQADMNIMKVDVFEERETDYSQFKNCIVICKKVDTKIKDLVADYVVDMPKLQDWQIIDYALAYCPGLNDKAAAWLYSAAGKNVYKVDSELMKLSLIDTDKQLDALRAVAKDKNSDLFVHRQVFDLVDALINGDRKTASEFIRHYAEYSSELDPIGLTTLTLNKLRNILLLNYAKGIDPKDIGVSSGAAYYIKSQSMSVPLDRIMKQIDFLSSIDSRLKDNPSNLDFVGCRKSAMFEYIVTGALACC